MTLLEPQRGAIPAPRPSPLTQPYWDGCSRGELLFQRCGACGHATHTPAYLCAHCTSQDLTWERERGHRRDLQLDHGVAPADPVVRGARTWRSSSTWTRAGRSSPTSSAAEHDAVEIGMRVEVEFHEMQGGFTLPYFRPVDRSA